jgi:hypothetical protein
MLGEMLRAPGVTWCLVAGCLLIAACDGGPTGPSVRLDETFVLESGQTATLQGRSVRIRFVGVTGDSRCPVDVVCVTGGDATVQISARSGTGPDVLYELHTGDLQPVRHGTLTITLLRLAPDPFSSQTIPPETYRATLRVTE